MAKAKLPPKLSPEAIEYYREMGQKGGKIGGPARAAKLSKKRRTEIARKAVQARWAKDKAAKAKGQKGGSAIE
jgi:hypothetical protein